MRRIFMLRNFMILALTGFSMLIGCSPVDFDTKPCGENCKSVVVGPEGIANFWGDYQVKVPKADILFVIDNSNSMITEQQRIASSFSGLLNTLSGIQWQIGITTMDIGPNSRAAVGDEMYLGIPADLYSDYYDANLQDGNLITFASGSKLLKHNDPYKAYRFQQAIQIGDSGTDDERGIFAASLALRNNMYSLVRSDSSHVAIVMLSDEDVRSSGDRDLGAGYNGYRPIRYEDTADYLADTWELVQAERGSKNLSVHSIIIRDGDENCYQQQKNQSAGNNYAEYGSMYQELSNDTRFRGIVGNICASSYTNQIKNMGRDMAEKARSIPLSLNCPVITDNSEYPFEITVKKNSGQEYKFLLGEEPPAGSGIANVRAESGVLIFEPALSSGDEVTYNGFCNR